MDSQNGYVAQETIFLDFDIIHLTFEKDGVLTVIPVVSDPLNIGGNLDNMDDDINDDGVAWWKIVILLVLLAPILPVIINALIWVITLPFKLIGWIFKSISDAVKKRKQ